MKIAVIDDDLPVLQSLRQLLGSFGFTVAPFRSAEQFLQSSAVDDVVCVVSDIRMEGKSGLDLQIHLAKSRPSLPVILITGDGDIEMAVAAVKAGAWDFIEKPFADERLVASIRLAIGSPRAPDDQHKLQFALRMADLPPRQKQVAQLLVAGLSSKEIARQLSLSPRTIENYRAWIMERLQVRNLAEMIRLSVETAKPHAYRETQLSSGRV